VLIDGELPDIQPRRQVVGGGQRAVDSQPTTR